MRGYFYIGVLLKNPASRHLAELQQIINCQNLPPSSSEPITSNGMFTYTIKQKHSLAMGTTFKNSASIYFDFNAPVLTNTTLNTLGNPAGIHNVAPGVYNSFSIYPNPANQTFNAIISSEDAGTANMNVSDITGKTMISKTLTLQKGEQTIATDVSSLAPGMYFVSFNENGNTQTAKLVIMK